MGALSRTIEWITRASVQRDVVLTVVGALAGWGISHLYYAKALADMKSDAEERKRVDELVFRGIESVGTLKYHRDSSGKVTGVIIELGGSASASSSATGRLSEEQNAVQGK